MPISRCAHARNRNRGEAHTRVSRAPRGRVRVEQAPQRRRRQRAQRSASPFPPLLCNSSAQSLRSPHARAQRSAHSRAHARVWGNKGRAAHGRAGERELSARALSPVLPRLLAQPNVAGGLGCTCPRAPSHNRMSWGALAPRTTKCRGGEGSGTGRGGALSRLGPARGNQCGRTAGEAGTARMRQGTGLSYSRRPAQEEVCRASVAAAPLRAAPARWSRPHGLVLIYLD